MPFANASIDVRAIDDLIRSRGEWVRYFVGSRCPCGSQVGRPDFTCPNCGGLGTFYPDPSQNMCAIIAEFDARRDPFGIPGFAIPGDLYMSVRPSRGKLPWVSDWDMIMLTWTDGLPQQGEDVIADASGIDQLAHPAVKVMSCYGIDRLATDQVNKIVTFQYGTDFVFVPKTGTQLYPQAIQWISQNRPTPGDKYVIKYTYQAQWIVFNPPREHWERGTSYGQTCLLRRRAVVMANMGA